MRIAVIGAGLAGLTAARALREDEHEVVVWEKSRGPGGRTSTRRGPGGMRFDHGSPFLHDGELPLEDAPALVTHLLTLPGGAVRSEVVGASSANTPAKRLADGLDLRTRSRVETILRSGNGYHLAAPDGGGMGVFDAVVVTAPAPQAADLLADVAPELAEIARGVRYAPCWSVMAAWDASLELGFTATTDIPGIAWAVAEGAKPGRGAGERWVLQADPDFTRAHLHDDPETVAGLVLDLWAARIGRTDRPSSHVAAHRWLYARPETPLFETFLRADTVIAAGDWCGGASAGAAVRSGRAAAAAAAAVLD